MPLLETDAEIAALLPSLRTIAVLGIKPASSGGPAYQVPAFVQRTGRRIIPVPVYYPEVTEILGEPVHRDLRALPVPVDAVLLFRRSSDVPQHLDDLLALAPRVVWMQLGIWHSDAAHALSEAGSAVVQDRCLQVALQAKASGA
jgi:predicted CoA-binding protein